MQFWNWKILREIGRNKSRAQLVECECHCGVIKILQKSALMNGKTKECIKCKRLKSMERKHIGKIFNKLKVIEQLPGKRCVCLCECGNKKVFYTGHVTSGKTISCGCAHLINRENYDQDMRNKMMRSVEINENGCWIWKKAKNVQGYGHFPYKRKVLLAHRASWMIFVGQLDVDILVCHKCDNPSCCNPDHLFLGTDKDNILDAIKKGRIIRKFHDDYKINELLVREIIALGDQGLTSGAIAKKFNISRRHAGSIVNRKSWKHVM